MHARSLIAVCFMLAALPAVGQEGQLIKEGQVDANKLIDALAPPPQNRPVRTRSLGIAREDVEASGGSASHGNVNLQVTFLTNSADLTPAARHSLDVVGQALASEKLQSYRFSIEGHADPRGSAAANLKLSQLRAQSVRDYLVQAQNIDKARLEAIGKGDREPLNRNNPEAPENRRVTIVNLSR
ncbi:Outer membrane lipoprotein Omp16 [Massilia sp. Bi118]|uniref:OmpA family protein n=1 Tax=Massilia sp. Bi118 TaxID=2822346 RepID=UPI001D444EA0|nr:OmpA family protein [Massilia sp. Bi118]CAH0296590.1 Outer membrane lipoprotein Omp16 [Massilia sp. Bi118]